MSKCNTKIGDSVTQTYSTTQRKRFWYPIANIVILILIVTATIFGLIGLETDSILSLRIQIILAYATILILVIIKDDHEVKPNSSHD